MIQEVLHDFLLNTASNVHGFVVYVDNTWSQNFWGSAFISCISGTAQDLLSESPVALHECLEWRLAGSWLEVSRWPDAWRMACLFGIFELIGATTPAHSYYETADAFIQGSHRWHAKMSGQRWQTAQTTSAGGKVGERRRGDQSGRRNKLPRLFCALRPGMKSLCGREPENPAWWREDRPRAHKLFGAWPWPPVQDRGRTQRRPPKWPDDVAHTRGRPVPRAAGRSLPPFREFLHTTTLWGTRDDSDIRIGFLN